MHGLADGVVAAEGEGEVADAAAHVYLRHLAVYGAAGLDECSRIVVVLGHTGGDGQHVGVEDDVLGRETDVLQQPVCAACYRNLAVVGVRLPLFVKEHHDGGGSHGLDMACLAQEGLLAFLQRDGVDDGFALHILQSRLDDIPPRRVNHHGHAGYVGLGGNESQECCHGLHAVYQAVVHADVYHLCAALHLLSCHAQRSLVVLRLYELLEFCRPCHVRPLTDIDEWWCLRGVIGAVCSGPLHRQLL